MHFEIDLRAIKACSFAMSSEETRYYLKGVCLEITAAHGVVAIATDGHRLIAMQSAPGNGGVVPGFNMPEHLEIIIPADTVKRIKINKRYSDGILRQVSDTQWQIEHDGQIWAFTPIDGAFPAWRRVLPKHQTPGDRAHFNPDYLADMQKAGEIYAKGVDAAIITDGGNPAWCRWDSADVPGFGVVMPKRLLADAFTMNPPSWAG
jgi:DNA polymerase III sliding clamp (beta) subunit (PCNA family)